MKVVAIDHVLGAAEGGGERSTIYFTAPHRVDFRALVRDLGATLHCRVELRQLSARDSARVQGGIGSCGRDLCCATFLTDFEPVTIRMAKEQDLPLNPLRISGACGRLMCCLKYEHPLYAKFAESAPAIGARVTTPEGEGRVVGHSVPRDAVTVRLDADGSRSMCSRADVCGSRRAYESRDLSGPEGAAR
jgi:cell fate regulator YaaT (PSP1 superfamily)